MNSVQHFSPKRIFTEKTTSASAERWVKVEEDGKVERVEEVKKAGMVGEVGKLAVSKG